ncbi:MAG TPA: ribosome maturation factor RimM [Spirochaetota bacterium]
MKNDEYIRIGHVSGPHGLKGNLKIAVITDLESRFSEGNTVLLGHTGNLRAHTVLYCEKHKGRIAIAELSGIEDRTAAENAAGADIFITRDEAEKSKSELSDGEFYYYDLVGCAVFRDDKLFGEIAGVIEGGAGHILKITGSDGKEYLLPFVDEMVDTSRILSRRIDITPVEGLF